MRDIYWFVGFFNVWFRINYRCLRLEALRLQTPPQPPKRHNDVSCCKNQSICDAPLTFWLTILHIKEHYHIYKLGDVGISNNLIYLPSLSNVQCSLSGAWIICRVKALGWIQGWFGEFGSGVSVEPRSLKWNERKYFNHPFSCEKGLVEQQ